MSKLKIEKYISPISNNINAINLKDQPLNLYIKIKLNTSKNIPVEEMMILFSQDDLSICFQTWKFLTLLFFSSTRVSGKSIYIKTSKKASGWLQLLRSKFSKMRITEKLVWNWIRKTKLKSLWRKSSLGKNSSRVVFQPIFSLNFASLFISSLFTTNRENALPWFTFPFLVNFSWETFVYEGLGL